MNEWFWFLQVTESVETECTLVMNYYKQIFLYKGYKRPMSIKTPSPFGEHKYVDIMCSFID